jgi:enoyl-CoA hydratase/carnithine racemase
VERLPNTTVLRLHERKSLAGEDLRLLHGVWDFFDHERRAPSRVLVVLAPSDLLSPQSLERLLGGSEAESSLTATEISDRILREENVIQRFIENVRALESFVVGVVHGEIAFQLAAPLLACDYRITSSDSVFVNTTQTLPRAPLASLPWLLARMVGAAKASQILLDVPRLPAEEAHELGLVNHVTAPGRLEAGALEVADRLGSLPRATLVSLKRAIIASGEDFQTYQQQELALTHRLASACWSDEKGAPHENRHTRLRRLDRPRVR